MGEINLGFSSNCFPEKSAQEIVDLLNKESAKIVDLRIGKEQLWEKEGIGFFVKNAIEVVFIGTSIVIGDKFFTPDIIKKQISEYSHFDIKVVASTNCLEEENLETTIRQIKTIKEVCFNRKIFVETHYGYANISTLLELNKMFGINLLLDIMGFMKISTKPMEDLKLISHAIESIQIKGFDWNNPRESKHLPINYRSVYQIEKCLNLIYIYNSKSIPITIETKSTTFIEDYKHIYKILDKRIKII